MTAMRMALLNAASRSIIGAGHHKVEDALHDPQVPWVAKRVAIDDTPIKQTPRLFSKKVK